MSMTTKKFKICRRLGPGVYEKCQGQKYILAQARRAQRARMGRRRRPSDYALALIEKQKVRFAYGVSEKQFAKYVREAIKKGDSKHKPATILFELLEGRLDNVIFRMGLAHTRKFARQLVTHGHFTVKGKRIDVPSYQTKLEEDIAIREGSKQKTVFADLDKKLKQHNTPGWVQFSGKSMSGKVVGVPKDPDPFFNFQAVIEFYSR